MSVEIRRGSARFVERGPGRLSQHAFSFGEHYDPARLSFGPMVCHDDHLLGAGQGFPEHPHSGLDIVTWVLSGSLAHADSTGTAGELPAGGCAVLSSGSGVRHSELAAPTGRVRFVQVWLRADDPVAPPAYARATPAGIGPGAGLVPVAGVGAPLPVGVAGAAYGVARLDANESVELPAAARVHAYVATGALLRSSLAEPLHAGDAFLMTAERAHVVTAGVPTELLVWSFTG